MRLNEASSRRFARVFLKKTPSASDSFTNTGQLAEFENRDIALQWLNPQELVSVTLTRHQNGMA
jgi:hypothetical protein